MQVCIFLLILMGLLSPFILRIPSRFLGWILGIVPALLFFLFFVQRTGIANGDIIESSTSWLPALEINFDYYLDGLSELFCLLITGIGTLIVIYSYTYLGKHTERGRYYLYLFLFMAAMLGTILSNNLITFFIFWELTSITSYLLISFNNTEIAARRAALQGLLITAGGGLIMLAGLIILITTTGIHDFSALFNQHQAILQSPFYVLIALLILTGAFTKSAQFPFHFWLPNAMQAPTPVSAFLHSATMVKLGIYLIARLTPILGGTHLWVALLTVVGGVTMITSSIMALRASDLKLILAYSTITALGTLVFLLASGNPRTTQAALIFLIAHALYKGGLFLCTGIIDHATGTRYLELLGGLRKKLPYTFIATTLICASMAGLPPAIGFITKEIIYEAKLAEPQFTLPLIAIAFVTNVVFVTIAILFFYKPFFGQDNRAASAIVPHEAPFSLWFAPLLLGLLGIFLGLHTASVDNLIIDPSVSAVLQNDTNLNIILWHGITPALLLSSLTFFAAIILLYLYQPIHLRLKHSEFITHINPENLYYLTLRSLNRCGSWLYQCTQSGYLRTYTLMTFLTLLFFVGVTFFCFHQPFLSFNIPRAPWFGWIISFFLLASACATVITPRYFASLAFLGVIGLCSTLLFLIYSAPDVAMTQLLVDVLTIVIVVMALYRLPSLPRYQRMPKLVAARNAVVSLLIGLLITDVLLSIISHPFNININNFYTRYSYTLAHGKNVVNVILVDFRAFDTLGEMIVVGLAGLGIYGLLKMSKGRERS